MSWDRKAERSAKFKKRKQSKNKGRSTKYKKELQEIEEENSIRQQRAEARKVE